MSAAEVQKYGKRLALERGGQYAQRPRRHESPDRWLDREMQTAFAALHGENGTIASRGIYEASEGYQWPWRKIGKRLREARAKQTPKEKVKRVVRTLELYIDRLYGSDDMTPAA